MKRFLIGVMVLSGTVGIGSVGAFYGHRFLPSAAPADAKADPQDEAAQTASRDLTPAPIPLADDAREMPTVSPNPFGGASAADEPAIGAANPYAEQASANRYAVAEQPSQPVDDYADDMQLPEESLGNDIPPASELDGAAVDSPAARLASPPAEEPSAYAPANPYAERTVAAEVPVANDPQAGDVALPPSARRPAIAPADEPQDLAPAAARPALDRYGRPVSQAETALPNANYDLESSPSALAEPSALPGALNTREQMPEAPGALPGGEEGTGRPGDPRLSGAQAPTLTIEKTAPPEIQIGKPAKFLIQVRNTGAATAHGVEVHDVVPQGTQLVETSPDATRGPEGELVWDLGSLDPGHEQSIELTLMPTDEGEIGSVATVHFRAEASVRTVATRPMLNLEVHAPDRVMKGQELTLQIKISNPGSGAATGVLLSELVPKGLSHPAGHELEFEVGTLKPGESRELALGLIAAEAGPVTNVLTAKGDANLETEVQTALEVIAPQLEVSMAGPKRRYLERNATHNISVSNPGTAPAKDIELVAVLPKELQFVQANNGGQFDAASHSVYWSLEELPPQETGTVTLTTLPVTAGDARLLIKSRAQQNLADQREEVVAIEGLAAINFQLSDVSDPIEVNGQTTYEIRVTNQGSKAAANVRVAALLPPQMKAISAEGPVRYQIEGERVVFEPLKQLAPKADTSYSITAQALQPGDLRLQVQIATDDISEPVTKEESTRVYGNE